MRHDMTDRVTKFLDRVGDVPTELRRRLALIRDLDEKTTLLTREIEDNVKQQLADGLQTGKSHAAKRQKTALSDAHEFDVEASLKRLMSLADEKVHIGVQVYDFIDKHIRSLDDDLRVMDGEMAGHTAGLQLPADGGLFGFHGAAQSSRRTRGASASGAAAAGAATASADRRARASRSRKKGADDESDAAAEGFALPAATAEHEDAQPVYCLCRAPGYGEMVSCDNPDCSIEWFHLGCVGLPPGAAPEFWLCPLCRPKQPEAEAGDRGVKGLGAAEQGTGVEEEAQHQDKKRRR